MSDPQSERNRLESWKQIAAYLGKSERTVRRWHVTEGLPVHRHMHLQKGSVWASTVEIDAWLNGRSAETGRPIQEDDQSAGHPHPPPVSRRWIWLVIPLASGLLLGALATRPPAPSQLISEPLTHLPGHTYGADFSPDGRHSVFYWGPRLGGTQGLYLKAVDSDTVVPLTSRDAMDNNTLSAYRGSPAWSPDGSVIAYLRRTKRPSREAGAAAGITELCFASASGNAREDCPVLISETTRYWGSLRHVNWTPDGKWVITPMNHGERQGIYAVSRSNYEARLLTERSADLQATALSPDGRKLAYLRIIDSAASGGESEIMRQDLTADLRPLGPPVVLHHARKMPDGFAWAPDGRDLLACLATSGGPRQPETTLYRMNGESGSQQAMTSLMPGPCWSLQISRAGANGNTILSYAVQAPQMAHLMRVTLRKQHGGEDPANYVHSGRLDHLPDHSPDGRLVAYISDRSGQPEIWAATADGRNARRLTKKSGVSQSSPPRWSPDGRMLAYAAEPDGTGMQLFVIPVAQPFRPVSIRVGQTNPIDPSWSEDGEWIFYRAGQSMWKVRASGGEQQKVLEWEPGLSVLRPLLHGGFIYFIRYEGVYTLMRRGVESGVEERLATRLASVDFAIAGSSAHFVRFSEDWRRVIYSLELAKAGEAGADSRPIITLPKYENINQLMEGLSVTPDGSELVFTVTGEDRSEIRMVKEFR